MNELATSAGKGDECGCDINAHLHNHAALRASDGEVSGPNGPVEEDAKVGCPWILRSMASIEEHQKHVDLKLRELVVSCPKVELVEGEALCVDLSPVGATVAIRAEGNQIFIIVGSSLSPRHNVMNVNFDLATGWNGAPVSGFDLNPTL